MFAKLFVGIIFVTIVVRGSLWFMEKERNDSDISHEISSNNQITVADYQIKPSDREQIKVQEKGKDESNIVLSPDQLYEQQINSKQTEFDLAPTIPGREVIPDELRMIEEEAKLSTTNNVTEDKDTMLDNPDQMNETKSEDELLPTEDYKEVIPLELEQMENGNTS